MALYQYGSSSSAPPPRGKTEFEILKASHRFLREDDDKNLSWDEQLASKYYASLYREFAVCDLKHYKSGNFALRWRTEAEVLSGNGETTCGNTRCEYHDIPEHLSHTKPSLTTLELPFVYAEQGETKRALVKVVLCPKCFNKLMWKRRKEKERTMEKDEEPAIQTSDDQRKTSTNPTGDSSQTRVVVKMEETDMGIMGHRRDHDQRNRYVGGEERQRPRRRSRSRSPWSNRERNASSRRHGYTPRPKDDR